MRIDNTQNTVAFKRALTPREEREYVKVLKKAKELIGQTGDSILIVPTSSLPQTSQFNSGVGNLSSDIAQDYLKFMKTYYGINVVEDLPAGQVHNVNNFYCSYEGTSLELGVHQINPELLVTDEFEHLLSQDDLKKISDANTSPIKENFANFKNVVDKGSSTDKALLKAFEKFKTLSETSSLKQKYKTFVQANSEWLNFKRSDEPNQEFFKFKQFLAEEHLKIGKARTNNLGLKLCGDCPIGFSNDEVAAFPNAFYHDKKLKIGEWSTRFLNFDEVTNPASDAYKLLKMKIQLAARRYDMLRIDAGWAYVTPKLTTSANTFVRPEMNSKVLNLIESWVKEVKGSYFNSNNILYEIEAGKDDFQPFKNSRIIEPLKNRKKVYTTLYMHDNGTLDSWGYVKAFVKDKGLSLDEFVLGVGNHDTQPLRQVAKGIIDTSVKGSFAEHKTDAIKVLSDIFHIPPDILSNPVEFIRAKFAESMMAKHNMFFFADTFGLEEAFNKHGSNKIVTPEKNFSLKVPSNYKEALLKAIQDGYGFNMMDSCEKIFKVTGLNETEAALYRKIVKFKNILNSKANFISKLTKRQCIAIGSLGVAVGTLGVLTLFKNSNKKENIVEEKKEILAVSSPSITMSDFLNKK